MVNGVCFQKPLHWSLVKTKIIGFIIEILTCYNANS